MAHSHETKSKLRQLYVFEHTPLEAAAVQCRVSYNTARRWKSEAADFGDDWDKLRAAHTLAGGELEEIARQLLTDLVLQFKATMDQLQADGELDAKTRVELLTSLSDSYNKAIGANKRLLPETSQLAVALEVLQRLAEYIRQHKPALLIEFMDVLEPFGEMLETHLK